MKGDLLGYILCPHCGTAEGMRVTEDKNGAPFGFCTASCGGQLRIGGDAARVKRFLALHPRIADKLSTPTATPPAPEPAPEPPDDPAPTPQPTPRRSLLEEVLIRR